MIADPQTTEKAKAVLRGVLGLIEVSEKQVEASMRAQGIGGTHE